MTASLETLVVAAYVFACSLSIPRPGPVGKITDQEPVALAVAQAMLAVPSDRQFLGQVARLLPGWFTHLPDQSQFNRRLRRLTPWLTTVQLMVAEWIAEGKIQLVDGTLILPNRPSPAGARRGCGSSTPTCGACTPPPSATRCSRWPSSTWSR